MKYYMNTILISENALTKWYLLGSIELLATLKCFIIICCVLPAEFWQKSQKCPNVQDMSELREITALTGHSLNMRVIPTVRHTTMPSDQCCGSVTFMFFCLLLFEGTLTSVFKDKQSKRSHKVADIKIVLTFLLFDGRIRIREAQNIRLRIRINNTGRNRICAFC